MDIREHLKLLGCRAKSKLTGFEGVVTSVSFDVNGCIQAAINPGVDKEGKPRDGNWHDVKSLEILSGPVVEQPDFVVVPGGSGLPQKFTQPNK